MNNNLPQGMPPPSAPIMIPPENVQLMENNVNEYHPSNHPNHPGGNVVLPPPYQPPSPTTDEVSFRNELLRQGYTPGLIHAIQTNRTAFAHCFWIIDNSGSMQTQDGHKIITNPNHKKLSFVSCSRWNEMVQTVDYHINMAALIHAPTTFRLLNHPGRQVGLQQIFTIANHSTSTSVSTAQQQQSMIDHDLANATHIMNTTQPNGVTPLREHIIAIRESIQDMLPQLIANGQKVAVVLATDGLPTNMYGNSNDTTNHEFREALRSLEKLPIWIVVRLCTDEESIVNFWNELDTQLEISLEVLDDYVSEGQEIYSVNPWLTYGLPLHRMREMGFYHRLFDLLDEQPLSKSDVRGFCFLLFGSFDCPDPDLNWDNFCTTVEQIQHQQFNKVLQWNPVLQKLMPWIDVRKLRQHGKPKGWLSFW